MSVAVSNINTRMPHPICNGHRRESSVNQQGNMAVSQIMDPDSFDFGFFAPRSISLCK